MNLYLFIKIYLKKSKGKIKYIWNIIYGISKWIIPLFKFDILGSIKIDQSDKSRGFLENILFETLWFFLFKSLSSMIFFCKWRSSRIHGGRSEVSKPGRSNFRTWSRARGDRSTILRFSALIFEVWNSKGTWIFF